jgi:hypothetical protein
MPASLTQADPSQSGQTAPFRTADLLIMTFPKNPFAMERCHANGKAHCTIRDCQDSCGLDIYSVMVMIDLLALSPICL